MSESAKPYPSGILDPHSLVELIYSHQLRPGSYRASDFDIPYRALLARFFVDVRDFITSLGDLSLTVAELRQQAEWLRSWAREDKSGQGDVLDEVADSVVESKDALRDVRSFLAHLAYLTALLDDLSGRSKSALVGYKQLADRNPTTINWDLWFCARHQYACLRLRAGELDGIDILCDLIAIGMRHVHMQCPETDYSFAELLRFLGNSRRQPSTVLDFLSREDVLANMKKNAKQPPPDSDSDGQSQLAWAGQFFRDRAGRTELKMPSELANMWSLVPPSWDERDSSERLERQLRYSMLYPLGAQDIATDFDFCNPADDERIAGLRAHIEQAQSMAKNEHYDKALAVLDDGFPASEAPDTEGFATVCADASRLRLSIKTRKEEADVRRENQRQQQLYEKIEQLEQADLKDVDAIHAQFEELAAGVPSQRKFVAIAKTVVDRKLQEREAMESKQRTARRTQIAEKQKERIEKLVTEGDLDAADMELAKLQPMAAGSIWVQAVRKQITERRADGILIEALALADQEPEAAEIKFNQAVQADNSLAGLVAALVLYCRLGLVGRRPGGTTGGLDEFRGALRSHLGKLVPLALRDNGTAESVWALAEKLVRDISRSGPLKDEDIRQFSAEIESVLGEYGHSTGVLMRFDSFVQLIRREAANPPAIGTAGNELAEKVKVRMLVSKGDDRLRDHLKHDMNRNGEGILCLDEAAEFFKKALTEEPENMRIRNKLVDCRVNRLEMPYHQKVKLMNDVCRRLDEEQSLMISGQDCIACIDMLIEQLRPSGGECEEHSV